MGDDGARVPGGRALTRAEVDLLVQESLRLERHLGRLDDERLEDLLDRTPYSPGRVRRRRRGPLPVGVRAALWIAVIVALAAAADLRHVSASADIGADTSAPRFYQDGTYEFLGRQSRDPDLPVGYNPCRSIPVEVNFRGATSDFIDLLLTTIRTINRVSGLSLDYRGATNRTRTASRATGRIVITFDNEITDPALEQHGGVGGSGWSTYNSGGTAYLTGGFVTLNTTYFASSGRHDQSVILSHELGHALGLAHAPGDEIMNAGPSIYGRSSWGHGDLTALAKLGSIPCS